MKSKSPSFLTALVLTFVLTLAYVGGTFMLPSSSASPQAGPVVTLADGKASAPALAFASSPGTGLYYGGSHSTIFTSNKTAKLTVGSGVTSNGAFTAASTLAATGAATFASTVAITGNTTVGGTLGVTGNATLSGTLAVTGATTSTGLVTANGGVTMGAGSNVSFDSGTASATAGAATLNKQSGIITSESLTTAAGSSYTLTLTNSVVAVTSKVFASLQNGTNSQGELRLLTVTPGSGSVAIIVKNIHATEALNGTIKISFFVIP